MSVDPLAPCIIGVAQHTVHPGSGPAPEPLALWEEVSRGAAADAGGRGGPNAVLDAVQSLDVLYCQSWRYDDPPGRLAERLGVSPVRREYSGIGGTTPHVLVARVAAAVARGDVDVGLVVGGEALETLRQARKTGQHLDWSHKDPEKKPFPFEAPFHPSEVAHEVFQAWLTFAVFEVAYRAHHGVDPDEHRRRLGRLLEPFSKVAAANPYAWFRQPRKADELIAATAENRMVGYPYTKTMISIMDVDMAAGIVVASHEAADRLGVPQERRVYLRGSGYAEDPIYVAEHDPMWASPAMAKSSAEALGAAGVGIDDIAHLDLYSCFASSVEFACQTLGLSTTDARGLTVTGGLPFSGGAGSGYLLHSTATMVEVLRRDPGSFGLVSGVGMHMTKHAFGVFSTEPTDSAVHPDGVGVVVEHHPGPPPRLIRDTHSGDAVVAAYSVAHGRSGAPEWGLAVCDVVEGGRTGDGAPRVYARFDDAALLEEAEATEWVGRTVRLEAGADKINRVVK